MGLNELSESKILRFIVERWKRHFIGVSALDIAEGFNKPHDEIIMRLRSLADKGKIHLRDGSLGRMRIAKSANANETPTIKYLGMTDTLIAFPDRQVLEKVFAKERKSYGVFTDWLHKGDSQIRHYYFEQAVLDKYLSYPDRYLISDDIVQGRITVKNAYYLSLPEDERDKQVFDRIRYGKMKLENGSIAIAAIAIDLSNLPAKEQEHWSSSEIEAPKFSKDDKEFKEYVRMMIQGEFGDYVDPLLGIFDTVKNINNIIGRKLFRNDVENPYLTYPVKNTEAAYHNAHEELIKLFSTDSLDQKVLVEILRDRMGVKEKELKGRKREYKGKWELLKMLIEKTPGASFEHFERCYKARQKAAHKVDEAKLPNIDLRETFRQDCQEILKTFEILACYLREHNSRVL
jgi:hypothetical protein